MILCGPWIYFELNVFRLDKTGKKGYNSYIISFQIRNKVSAPALVCSRAFFLDTKHNSIRTEHAARERKVENSNQATPNKHPYRSI